VEDPDAYNRDADGNLTTRKDINQRSMIADKMLNPEYQVPGALRFAATAIPGANFALNYYEKLRNDPSRGIGNYQIGGMDASQKGVYDTLAAGNMLFDTGNTGIKTLTGKNITGKGYGEGQLQNFKDLGFEGLTPEEIEKAIEDEKTRHSNIHGAKSFGHKYKKMKEAAAYKFGLDKQKIHGDGDDTGGGKKNDVITEDIHGDPWDSQSHAQDMADQYAGGDVAQYNEDIADIRAEGGRVGYNRGRVVNPGGYSGNTYSDFLADKTVIPHPDDKSWRDVFYRWLDSRKAEGGRVNYFDGGIAGLL